MIYPIPIFKRRGFLGATERRLRRLGRRAPIVIVMAVWGFAAYQVGLERDMALMSSARNAGRQAIGGAAKQSATAPVARRMPACIGPIRVNCVVDGDTIWLSSEKIRIEGIDAPEIDGKCRYERQLARRAKDRLSALLSAEPLSLVRSGKDRYGRTLASIHLTNSGDVGVILVREGLARTWTGRRMPWCFAHSEPR